MLTSKLDNNMLVKWKEERNALDVIPNMKEFNKFIIDRADILPSTNVINLNNENSCTLLPTKSLYDMYKD